MRYMACANDLWSSIGGIDLNVIWRRHICDKSTPNDYKQCEACMWARLSGAHSHLPNYAKRYTGSGRADCVEQKGKSGQVRVMDKTNKNHVVY